MKTSMKSVLVFFCMIMMGVSLSSCGSNLFSLEDETYDNLDEQLVHAETYDELEEVITKADQVINDENASTADVQQALAVKGQSILKQQGVNSGVILEQLIPLVEASKDGGSQSGSTVNVFNLIDVSTYDIDELADASDALNTASDTDASGLDSNDQYQRGLGNMLTTIKLIDLVYTVDSSQEEVQLTPKDSSQTSLERLTQLMEPENSNIQPINVYAEQASSAFDAADVFDADVEEDLDKIDTAASNIAALYDATRGVGSNGYIFIIGSNSYNFNTADPDEVNTSIDNAMNDIFNQVSI